MIDLASALALLPSSQARAYRRLRPSRRQPSQLYAMMPLYLSITNAGRKRIQGIPPEADLALARVPVRRGNSIRVHLGVCGYPGTGGVLRIRAKQQIHPSGVPHACSQTPAAVHNVNSGQCSPAAERCIFGGSSAIEFAHRGFCLRPREA